MVKQEALTIGRFINEVLIQELNIPLKQIVNDTRFDKYTHSKRPDLLISEIEYDTNKKNDTQFIENLVAYAEAKDDSTVLDSYWRDAVYQGKTKAQKLNLPYFIITNCKTSIFYNSKTGTEIRLNNNPIREFQTLDVLRLIKNKITKNPELDNIVTNVDTLSVISEAVFSNKLWELEKIYRQISFDNNDNIPKIDFTIGFIALEFFEEREIINNSKDKSQIYWSECSDGTQLFPADRIVANISQYIERLVKESQFSEFVDFMEKVQVAIKGNKTDKPIVKKEEVKQIYNLINSMTPLHGAGFDLFGAVYEKFANSKEKKEFGQYFTRRHYTHILAKLLLRNEKYFDKDRQFRILDPACGTGGFLTEGFKILRSFYLETNTYTKTAEKFLQNNCFWGYDAIKSNIARTKLNMFLVGDGHTNMSPENTLLKNFKDEKWDYIMTNPPYGAGTIKAETSAIGSMRTEIAFLYKIIHILKDGGKACVILPDGVLENPSLHKMRKDFLEKCMIDSIISLPKFAFAPYTKEKTYAVFFTKKNRVDSKIQKEPIWMYIIDNDGYANSDKRFPTKLKDDNNRWMHDEISGWINNNGEEMVGILEEKYKSFDDSMTEGTPWINEKGLQVKLRKGGFVSIERINDEERYYNLLPEYYMRPDKPKYITLDELSSEISKIKRELNEII